MDDDGIDMAFDFDWHCADASDGGPCVFSDGEVLDTSSQTAFMSIPAGSLPIGKLSALERSLQPLNEVSFMVWILRVVVTLLKQAKMR